MSSEKQRVCSECGRAFPVHDPEAPPGFWTMENGAHVCGVCRAMRGSAPSHGSLLQTEVDLLRARIATREMGLSSPGRQEVLDRMLRADIEKNWGKG